MQKLFLLFLLIGLGKVSAQSITQTYKNLIFEGGGVRGLAYAGALMEMDERNLLDSVNRVAGTSAGGIAACLYAVGYTPSEILHLISEMNIKSFADGRFIFIGGMRRMVKHFGWYRGERFNRWIGNLIKTKTGKENLTFEELYLLTQSNSKFKQLYLTATNLSLQKTSILCHETFPKMEIRTGVRITMSIPFFFRALIVNQEGRECSKKERSRGQVMIDGGITANFPIHIFDYQKYLDQSNDSSSVINQETIGFRLDSEDQIEYDRSSGGLAPVEIKKLKDFTNAFYRVVLENLNRQNLTTEDWERTVSISTAGISPRIKRMPENQKNLLVENGRKGVKEYLINQK
jgi:NTE family protein